MKDPRFDTQDDFIERYDGYREVGHINDGMDGQNPDTVSYDIYIEHEYTTEEMDAVNLRQVESIAMENSPNVLSADAFWFGDSKRLFNDKAELYIGLQSLNEQVDRRPMVEAVQKYMDACVLGTESGMEKFCREYAEKYKSVMPAAKERLQYLDEIVAGNGLKFSMTDEAGADPQFMLETVEPDFADVVANIPVNDNMEREVYQMERKLTQKDLKEALASSFELYGAHVDKITFKTGIGADDKPEFNGASITFKEGSANRTAGKVYNYVPGELAVMLNRQFNEEGLTAADENNVGIVDVNFDMGTRMVSGTPIPVFKGITAQLQEYDRSVDMIDEEPEEYYADQKMVSLADIRRQEHVDSLKNLGNQDIMEMARAHFDSHPTLPGEKNLKMMVNDGLANDGALSDEQREQLINGYAQTRIRETKMDSIGREFDPKDLNMEFMSQNGTVSMNKVNVELQRQTADDNATVYVLAERADGRHMTIGKLPDKFLTNSPMNVESCKAELQVMDYSNGKFKNVSMRVVADTDLMSGDVLDLDDTMLAGLDQDSGLEQ